MASAAQNALPVLYVELEPLSSTNHAGHRLNPKDALQAVASLHAVPLTVDEFVLAQRDYPIIFTSGPNPVPLALMRSEEHTSELQSLMRLSYAVFCLKKKTKHTTTKY